MQTSIKKDYFWNTIGVFAQNAISPLLLIAITRINGIYDSGVFSFAFSVAIIFWALAMWGGRTYQVSDVRHQFSHRSYIMVRLILAVFLLVGAFAFSVANHYDAVKSGVILTLVLFKVIESVADAIYGVLQVHGRLFITGKSLLYKAASGFGLFVTIDILTKSILLSSLAIVAANILFVIFYDIRITRKVEDISIKRDLVAYHTKEAVSIIRLCAPVAVVIFLSMFSLNIPRYFVDMYHPEQIGYFGIIAMPITLIGLLMSFILQPKVVHLSKLHGAEKYREFNAVVMKLASITLAAGLGILLAVYVAGIPILKLVFGIDFSGYKSALLIIVGGGIINAIVSILINLLIIVRRFKHQFYILLVTNILLAVCSAATVRRFGLLGGATLFAAANILQVLLLGGAYMVVLRRAMNANSKIVR